jgi:cytochrome c oxidase subunit 2
MEFLKNIYFQDSATPLMEGIRDLHDFIFGFLTFILLMVLVVFGYIIKDFYRTYRSPSNAVAVLFREDLIKAKNVTHGVVLEIVWTLIPSVILMLIAFPSFVLLYAMDELIDPTITFKVIGHQWYWVYEYADYLKGEGFKSLNFDSYMVYTDDLTRGQLRLLEVDRQAVLPINTHVRLLITSGDVLHSWGIPSLGVKMDAVPGRLNQVSIFLKREGVFYGQCSELCGVNHGFMPIALKGVSFEEYVNWVKNRA